MRAVSVLLEGKRGSGSTGDDVTQILLSIAIATVLASHVVAQEQGDAKKGEALAVSVCAQCHAVQSGQSHSPNPKAPSFSSVARTRGMTDRTLRVWLQSSHPTMPNFILTTDERNNVIAYILSLKSRRSAM
jgi:mono/diheme cytochrome c family protein